jgi:hypothetical protein
MTKITTEQNLREQQQKHALPSKETLSHDTDYCCKREMTRNASLVRQGTFIFLDKKNILIT